MRRIRDGGDDALLRRPAMADIPDLAAGVETILDRVRRDGDAALLELTVRFDRVQLSTLAVSARELDDAEGRISSGAREALERAHSQIRAFHEAQRSRPVDMEVSPGVRCERRVVPIERVGLYVPGGTAPLPSTLLMLGVPAAIAGCPVRVLCTPPRRDGSIDPHILVAARLCGIDRMFKLGGAQAIGALAFGTESVPRVDKIFGPGNAWVTQAKLAIAGEPGGASFDLPAGPSEVLVIADAHADPAFVAADLLSQAEHDVASHVVLVTPAADLPDRVQAELDRQLPELSRREIAGTAMGNALCVTVDDLEQAFDFSNRYAPEHLILQIDSPRDWIDRVRNAGSVFLGPWSPEAVGDYASGTNHVLPTYGFARSWSGLGLDSFMKSITFQELTPDGLRDIGPTVERLASVEGLGAHERAVSLRLERLGRRSE